MVEKIRQVRDTIYILANFDMDGPTYLPTVSSPAYFVKVHKEKMTQFGQLTFILLDQTGSEKARTIVNIPRPD